MTQQPRGTQAPAGPEARAERPAAEMVHTGGCHCGAVRFAVRAPAQVVAHACNCSICHMVGYQHLIVPRDRFEPLSAPEALACYTFNSGVARHYFCRVCGVKPWYVPRSHPEGISVNVRALDEDPRRQVTLEPFDGRNWEANVARIR